MWYFIVAIEYPRPNYIPFGILWIFFVNTTLYAVERSNFFGTLSTKNDKYPWTARREYIHFIFKHEESYCRTENILYTLCTLICVSIYTWYREEHYFRSWLIRLRMLCLHFANGNQKSLTAIPYCYFKMYLSQCHVRYMCYLDVHI